MDFLVINDCFYLYYDVEPGKRVFYVDIDYDEQKLICTSCLYDTTTFYTRDEALDKCDEIQRAFKLMFNIERL